MPQDFVHFLETFLGGKAVEESAFEIGTGDDCALVADVIKNLNRDRCQLVPPQAAENIEQPLFHFVQIPKRRLKIFGRNR